MTSDHSGLDDALRGRDETRLWVGGLSLDVCVRATVLEGLTKEFHLHVIAAGTRPVDPRDEETTLRELVVAGAVFENADGNC